MRTTVALDEALVSRAQLLSGFQERSALLRGGSEAKLEAIPRRRAGRFHNTYFEAKMAGRTHPRSGHARIAISATASRFLPVAPSIACDDLLWSTVSKSTCPVLGRTSAPTLRGGTMNTVVLEVRLRLNP